MTQVLDLGTKGFSVDGMGFRINESLCLGLGTDINAVMEYSGVTLIPMTERWLLGIIRYEQELVPVIDLGLYSGGTPCHGSPKAAILLVMNADEKLIGLVVDDIIGLKGFQHAENANEEVTVPRSIARYVVTKANIEGATWLMLDLQMLVTEVNEQDISVVRVGE